MLTIGLLAVAAALPLDLVWNVSPSPHTNYVACGGNTTVCIEPGEWLGICRTAQFGATTKTFESGTLTVARGEAVFSRCPHYEALIAKSVKLGGDPARAAFAEPGCEASSGASRVTLAPLGNKTVAVKSNPDGTLQFSEIGSRVSACDKLEAIGWSAAIAVVWDGPPMPVKPMWRVDVIGDLNQDGATELIISRDSTRSATDTIALLGSVRGGTFERLAATVTTPKLALTPEAKLVQAVQDARDACEHWAGEDGNGDARRNTQIAAGQKKHCGAFKAKLGAALRKHPSNSTLIELSKSELAK